MTADHNDEVEEIVRLISRATLAQMGEVIGFEVRFIRNCVFGLTGEPVFDSNALLLGPNPDVEAFMRESIARARARGLPLLVNMSPHVAAQLEPVAVSLGLKPLGRAPIMVLRLPEPLAPARPIRVVRALGADLIAAAGDLAAAAFDAPRDVVARCMDVGYTPSAAIETYVAFEADTPVSAVSVTPSGDTAGIWAMATPPEHQRHGFGRGLLTQVVNDLRKRGVTRVFLVSSPAGRPLYTAMGFAPIAELTTWMMEA